MIRGLAHAGVFVKDLNVSKNFYADTLGFEIIWECKFSDEDNTYNIAIIKNGDLTIELVEREKQTDLSDGVTDHVAMLVDDLDKTIEDLIKKGIVFETDEPVYEANMMPNGSKWIFFRGPDNEHIELTQVL